MAKRSVKKSKIDKDSVFLLVTIAVGIYSSIMFSPHQPNQAKIHPAKASKVLAAAITKIPSLEIPTPTATATPTPVLSPVPQPTYSGYCLHVPVLMYHHIMPYAIAQQKGQTALNVDDSIFDQHMGYLVAHGYTILFADELINALKNHTSLPSKSIVITIDDGYEDNYTYAFPAIKKYNIKTSLMIPTGLLGVNSGTNNYMSWNDLKAMTASGIVQAYNHTFSHFAMGSQTESKDAFEITTAQQQLQENFGRPNTVFAYPYGTNATLSRLHPLLESQGITGAFSTIDGEYQCDSFMYSLHRTRVGNIPFPAFGIE